MVEIDESILLTVAGMVFVPVFIFAIKMIMEVGNLKTRTDSTETYIKEAKEMYQRVIVAESEIKSMKQDILYKFGRQEELNDRHDKSIDRLNQFSWGTASKSYPPYMTGEDETREHQTSAGEGLFEDKDSEETQKVKDARRSKSGFGLGRK